MTCKGGKPPEPPTRGTAANWSGSRIRPNIVALQALVWAPFSFLPFEGR